MNDEVVKVILDFTTSDTYICDSLVKSFREPYGIEDKSLPCSDLKRSQGMNIPSETQI